MNLKEAFTYQNFLDRLAVNATESIRDRSHAFIVHQTHKRKAANVDAEDTTEIVDAGEFSENDDVIRFMDRVIELKHDLSAAITNAKMSVEFDMDAELDANRLRRSAADALKQMLRFTSSTRTEKATDYKFNVEGNQTSYRYDVEIVMEERFDRAAAKSRLRDLLRKADEVSAKIDTAMVTTEVEFDAPFDVNDTFEDAMEEFLNAA